MEEEDFEDLFLSVEDVENLESDYSSRKAGVSHDAHILLIDALIFKVGGNENEQTVFLNILSRIIREKIYTPKAKLAIAFYNSKVSKNIQGVEKVYLLCDFSKSKNELMREVLELIDKPSKLSKELSASGKGDKKKNKDDEEDEFDEDFEDDMGRIGLELALWFSGLLFTENKFNSPDDIKRIWIFTRELDIFYGLAPGGISFFKTRLIEKKKDLDLTKTEFKFWPLMTKGDFDQVVNNDHASTTLLASVGALKEMFKNDFEFLNHDIGSIEFSLDVLFSIVRRKVNTKRTIAKCDLILGGDDQSIRLPLKVYALRVASVKPASVKLDARTLEVLATQRKWICNETAKYLDPSKAEIVLSTMFGGRRVFIPESEKSRITMLNPDTEEENVGIKIIKFQDLASFVINPRLRIKAPYFAQINNENANSRLIAVFNMLVQIMDEQKRIAIADVIFYSRSPERICALLPQVLDREGQNFQGFWIHFLPYSQDLRTLPSNKIEPLITTFHGDNHPHAATSALVDCLTKKLDALNFNPRDWENPSIAKHYALCESLSFQQEFTWSDEEDDKLLPDKAFVDAKENKEVFVQYLSHTEAFEATKGGTKRSAAGNLSIRVPAVKKLATIDVEQLTSVGDIRKHVQNGSLDFNSLTANRLKYLLEICELKLSGKKADLVERLEWFFKGD